MNYIGSKLKLCQKFLPTVIRAVCGDDLSQKSFCDIFAGTGIVGRTFKTSVKKVIANDIEYYSYVLNKNYIENHDEIENKNKLIEELNLLPLINEGFIYSNYCLGGNGERQYFSDDNGRKIDTIRTAIENWKNESRISESLYYFLLCSLLESADKVANTASVYGAYLKS
jgi:adenine-specific DNA-methyltransferase